ncbi:hypothetical protein CPB84DRAFT_1849332 [Gymnopilus junonius]|uniref:F-box domain-containing protein n=1 Tax=Gymnopilus junonius TaxID=109634 RepID=A0A9P5TKQ2_GYMJU|nr:hypothetical protein CPB84DRAFT_1849332 [Gymnopilus junonius]
MGEHIAPFETQDPFFSQIDDPLLTSIFMINTDHKTRFVVTPNFRIYDPKEELPLTIARRTSQVCCRWRKVILQSPLIWGSVIDFDLLRQKKDFWRKEVMRRTGSAPLCIMEHWERIRKLDVELKVLTTESPSIVRKLKKRPAPNLEFIIICSHRIAESGLSYNYREKIYAGRKPEGGNYSIFVPTFPRHLHAVWLLQLRGLTIGWMLEADIFPLLERMTLLETLKIDATTDLNMDNIPTKHIFLPNLVLLDLRNHFQFCHQVLASITPSPNCVLTLTSYDWKAKDVSSHCDKLPSMTNILKKYTAAYFGTRKVSHLKLFLSGSRFSIETSMGPATTSQLLHFEVHPDEKLPFIICSSIMDCIISAVELSSITTLEVALHPTPKCDMLHSDLVALFSACTLTRIIQVTKKATDVLYELAQEHHSLFPSLEVLCVKTEEPTILTRSEQVDYFEGLLALLEARQELKSPVKVLDLTGCDVGKSAIIEFWDKSVEVNVRRREELCVMKNGHGDSPEHCHSCGIAQILDMDIASFKGLEEYTYPIKRQRRGFAEAISGVIFKLFSAEEPKYGPAFKWGPTV